MAIRIFIPLLVFFVIFLYIAYLNPGEVTFVYAPGKKLAVPTIALLMVSFVAGSLALSVLYFFRSFGDFLVSIKDWFGTARRRRIEKRLDRATDKLEKGKLKQALGDVERALSADPENFDALLLKGRILRMLGDRKKALETHSLALALRPSDTSAILQVKDDYMAAGQLDTAYKLLERVRGRKPRELSVLREMRAIREKQNDLKRAIVLQTEIMKYSSGTSEEREERQKTAELYCAHARRLIADKRHGGAIKELAKAAKLMPDFLPASMMMGDIAMELGDSMNAEKLLRDRFKATRSLIPLRKLEEIYTAAGRPELVEELYSWALSLFPQEGILKLFMAMVKMGKSDYESAEKILKELEDEFSGVTLYNLAVGVVELNTLDGDTYSADRFRKALQSEWAVFMSYRCSHCRQIETRYFPSCPACGKWNTATPFFRM